MLLRNCLDLVGVGLEVVSCSLSFVGVLQVGSWSSTPGTSLNIEKVYIDGSCELLTRRSIDILLAENFLDPGNSQAHAYCEHWNKEIKYPFKTQAKHRQRSFRATMAYQVLLIYVLIIFLYFCVRFSYNAFIKCSLNVFTKYSLIVYAELSTSWNFRRDFRFLPTTYAVDCVGPGRQL